MSDDWVFDQAENVAAVTSRQVIEDGAPILQVSHYSDDDSWLFTCETTSGMDDFRIVGMGEIVSTDPSLSGIASLPPGWGAHRSEVGGEWTQYEEPDT